MRRGHAGLAAAAVVAGVLAGIAPPAVSGTLPPGFRETTVLRDLDFPMAARFAADGRVFVAEKSGIVKVFDSLADTTPTTFADLRTKVHNFHDRGVLGLALDPAFPAKPYVYVFYTHDARDRRHGAALGHAGRDVRRLPDAARRDRRRLRRERPGVAPDGCRRRHDRPREGPRRGLVPAVPEPRAGARSLRRGRLPLRHERRRRGVAHRSTTDRTATR